jgi:hypothetical protein
VTRAEEFEELRPQPALVVERIREVVDPRA